MLDASCPAMTGRPGHFVPMGVDHNRARPFGGLVHDYFELVFGIGFVPWVGIRPSARSVPRVLITLAPLSMFTLTSSLNSSSVFTPW